MHTHQFFTWITHSREHTTLLGTWTTHTAEDTTLPDYKKLYTYMCNTVTEFYLYSIVYIYLINSRLDVTFSVRHHFRTIQLYQYVHLLHNTVQNISQIVQNHKFSYY